MKILSKLFFLCTMVSVLFITAPAYAHKDHDINDVVISSLGDLGAVNFPSSCSAGAQHAVNNGVGLLHHMMYAQAERLFSQWIKTESTCAMMHWGYAMSLFHPMWPDTIQDEAAERGQLALANAQQLKTTKREQAYIHAALQYFQNWQTIPDNIRTVRWARAQGLVYQQNPSDIDAAAFYALSQLVIAPKNDPWFSENKKVGALLEQLSKLSPTHPGAIHYTIHAYDNPPLARLAIDAARAYDKIAPDVPHALHMPSHIFVRLGIWADVVNWNIRSAAAALKYPSNGSTSMHYLHAMDYLVYGYLQLGEVEKARLALEQVKSFHPVQPVFPSAYALAAMPARLALEQKKWRQASQLKIQQPSYIAWGNFPQVEAITYYARGLGAARSENLALAKQSIARLDQLYEKSRVKSPDHWAPLVDAQRQVVIAWINFSEGKKNQALVMLRRAADIEDSIDKNPVTPAAVLPARELLADMLLINGDYTSAIKEYKRSLLINPNRLNSVAGIKHALSELGELTL